MKKYNLFRATISESITEEEKSKQEETKTEEESETPFLDNFGKDLTKMAEEGKLEPVIGRDKEIFQVLWVLSRKNKNNPVVIGDPGVGKTAIVEKVYDISIKDDSTYIANGVSVHNSPPGYVGYGEGGQLTEKVRRKPYSIILFDEIEKAHPDVLSIMLQIFDDGQLTDGQGRKVDFKNTIIVMTSNIGTNAIQNMRRSIGFGSTAPAATEERTKDIIKTELAKTLAPEFINRIDDVIVFSQLGKNEIYKIIDIEIAKLAERLKDMGYSITITDNVKDLLMEVGYDPSMGARPLKRAIQTKIEDPISDEILKKNLKDVINIDYDKSLKKLVINGNVVNERFRFLKNLRVKL